MKKILVCRIGAFGDICMTLPVVHSLSARFEVHWLIRQGHDAILKLFPQVKCHPVIFGAGPNVLSGLVSRLGAAQYDALLDFSNWEIIGRLASQLKGIPLRATAYDSTRRLVFQRMKNGLPWFKPFNKVVEIEGAVHRVFKWQQLIKASLGCTLSIHWPLEPVRIPEESVRIFVHPHASKPSKLWSLDNMVAVLAQVGERKTTHCFINEGHPGEKKAAEELGSRLRRAGLRVTSVAFDSSFVGLREALQQVHFALGLDSGPMHFASLLGVPTVVVYGPYSPTEVAPLWRTVAVTPPQGSGSTRKITPAMAFDGISKLFSLVFDRSNHGVRW
jgi:ADP-heptose:LPS heptosyltransferase